MLFIGRKNTKKRGTAHKGRVNKSRCVTAGRQKNPAREYRERAERSLFGQESHGAHSCGSAILSATFQFSHPHTPRCSADEVKHDVADISHANTTNVSNGAGSASAACDPHPHIISWIPWILRYGCQVKALRLRSR